MTTEIFLFIKLMKTLLLFIRFTSLASVNHLLIPSKIPKRNRCIKSPKQVYRYP